MQAKCPECGGSDEYYSTLGKLWDAPCLWCHGSGFIAVHFPDPETEPVVYPYAKVCNDCGGGGGGEAGGGFANNSYGEPHISQYAVCPGCGGKNLRVEKCSDVPT